MYRRKPFVYLFVMATLLLLTAFGAYTVSAQSESNQDATSMPDNPSETAFDPQQMAETMGNMVDQMQAMMEAASTDAERPKMAPAMTNTLNGMVGLNQSMMDQMQSMPEETRAAMAPQMMDVTGRMADMMGQMQPLMSGAMPMGMMAGGMMDSMTAITGTMPMSGTMPMDMTGGGVMDGAQMAQMMAMMGPMMQMMGQMHASMADGTMGSGMMDGTTVITGTMPISGTMPMDMMGGGAMDGAQMAQMMAMMGPMMQMMGQMHASMADGMMGSGMMDGTTVITGTMPMSGTMPLKGGTAMPGLAIENAPLEAKSVEAGGVTVEVMPLTLQDAAAESLDFQVALNTHSVELDQDLADIAVLAVDGVEFAASGWDGSSGGHHISGVLSFAALDEADQSILEEADSFSVVIRDLGGVSERVFTWDLVE